MNDEAIRRFFRRHGGTAVGMYPDQKEIDTPAEKREDVIEWATEQPAEEWKPVVILEQPVAKPGEFPERFIDGCHTGHAVACLRAPDIGWPIPVFLAEPA